MTALVGSETLWHARAREFFQALQDGRLADTYLAPHPGVTTMWLAGLARELALLADPGFDGLSVARRINIEIIPSAIVISLAIVAAYFMLRRIFDGRAAALAATLLALDPYHISISKVIHVDALLSAFMLLAALALWLFLADGRRLWVLLSGVSAGLALLTKAPALFLLPYFGLCLLAWQANLWRERRPSQGYAWRAALGEAAGTALLWLLPLAVTYFLLWPAMWQAPVETLRLAYGGAGFYAETPHEYPLLFLGQVTSEDPGPLFYPVNLAIKTTAVSLTGFLLCFYALARLPLRDDQRRSIWLGMAFIFFFILMMTLGAKKLERYVLPALQFVTLLAGAGWFYTLRRLWGGRQRLLNLSLALLAGLQLAIAAAHFPYFGAHYNYLLGGPRRILESEVVAGQEFGIGVEQAGAYLNRYPLATELVVGAQNWLDFYHYFRGKTVPLTDDKVDYVLFTRNWTLRGTNGHEWREVWETYGEREPKEIVRIDGVPYVWIYKTGPLIDEQAIAQPLNVVLGRGVRLLGYDLAPREARPGDVVTLTLYWEALDAPLGDYTVFAHLLDPAGELRGQQDNQPQGGMYPTYLWDEGERVADQYAITIDRDAPPGAYDIALGMYILETLQRLPAVDGEGRELRDRQLLLPGPRVLPRDS